MYDDLLIKKKKMATEIYVLKDLKQLAKLLIGSEFEIRTF